ncbi:HNH endonuclease [Aeromonas sp. 2MA4]|uniref:HNH endonuclease n=1 Tax=Aeromonas sp. 2MA4 TaxID=2699195 RepID=UPI0023DDD7FD|nr:HNH endonuclease [Aeromonas sp. 2MA4]MDF2393233.1 HNH endonuclease [Aeromonas sp. 2MA4]
MAKINFTADEISEMIRVYNHGHAEWSNIRVATIKWKIKSEKARRQGYFCCYCQENIYNEYNLSLDIEHIIPKSKLKKHLFTTKNLSVACKRCNMKIKKDDVSFLTSPLESLPKRIFRSKYYKIIHPNLDNYTSHLVREARQSGRNIIVKYLVNNNSEKGFFTREYFKLSELERASFNKAQGGTVKNIENQNLMELFNKISQ